MLNEDELTRINRALANRWGSLFRVVYSEDQFEVRVIDGKDELRRKYPSFRHCYILERDVKEQGHPPELKTWNGYEIIWPFLKHGDGDPVDPTLEVCMFITTSLMHGVKRTLQDHYNEEKKQFDKEVQQTYEMLENESPYIATAIQNRAAIVAPDIKKVN